MTIADWIVVVAGIGAIGWVNWYFFVAPRRDESGVARAADSAAATSASDTLGRVRRTR
jgi:hypothetical protein